jgi:hypothetical protein
MLPDTGKQAISSMVTSGEMYLRGVGHMLCFAPIASAGMFPAKDN